jgi:HlyD family type I secretion membrane fusion protein
MSDLVSTEPLAQSADVSAPGRIGLAAILLAVGALVTWSELAPIASAVIAPGVVVVENSRRVVQHADGGTVKSIVVQDGSHVREGDVLITLDDRRLATTKATIATMLELNHAQTERLRTERAGINTADPPNLADEVTATQSVASEAAQFRARRNALIARVEAIRSERVQNEAALPGVQEQIRAQATRLRLTEVELSGAAELAKLGAGTRNRVLELAKIHAEIEGVLSGLRAREAELTLKVAHSALDVAKINSTFIEGVETELHGAQRERVELEDKLAQVNEQLGRTQITAPVSGTVVNLAIHTVGGVVSPGAVLMEIVPDNEKLVIESQIRPEDADGVHEDAAVDVRVSGAGSKRTKRLLGRVLSISADRLTDRLRGNSYFILRAEVPRLQFEEATERTLYPGMPVELFVNKGQKTIVEYLVSPITDFFARSFRQ